MIKNKVIILISMIVFALSSIAAATMSKFVLIIPLYNEINENRTNEYITCLMKNLAHKSIEQVHVIYDTSKDSEKNRIFTYLKNNANIRITFSNKRPSYEYCFQLANSFYPGKKIILSNADMFFNDTLALLENYDFTNTFFALTRWNCLNDGSLEIFKQYNAQGKFIKTDSESSQDVWIFKTPIKHINCDDICLGLMACDSVIAYRAQKSGLIVKNPCLTIQCCHLHLTEKKDYTKQPRPYKGQPIAFVPWEKLS